MILSTTSKLDQKPHRIDFLSRAVKDRVKAAVSEHFGLNNDHLYLSHPTFFSRITNAPAQTLHDEYWHVHIDKETYPSFHYTSLLYLTDFGIDFQGGSFVFVDAHDNMNRYGFNKDPNYGNLWWITQ